MVDHSHVDLAAAITVGTLGMGAGTALAAPSNDHIANRAEVNQTIERKMGHGPLPCDIPFAKRFFTKQGPILSTSVEFAKAAPCTVNLYLDRTAKFC